MTRSWLYCLLTVGVTAAPPTGSANRLVYGYVDWDEVNVKNSTEFADNLKDLVRNGLSDVILLAKHNNGSMGAVSAWENLSQSVRNEVKAVFAEYSARLYMSLTDSMKDLDPIEFASTNCKWAIENQADGVDFGLDSQGSETGYKWWRQAVDTCYNYTDRVINTLHFEDAYYHVRQLENMHEHEKYIVLYFNSTATYNNYESLFEEDPVSHTSIKEIEQMKDGHAGQIIAGKNFEDNATSASIDQIVNMFDQALLNGYDGGIALWKFSNNNTDYQTQLYYELRKYAGVTSNGTRPLDPNDYNNKTSILLPDLLTDHTTSAVDRTTSAVDRTTSAVDRTTSAVDRTTSAVDRTTSAVDRTTSAVDRTTSAVDRTTSAVDRTTSAVDRTTSAVDRTTSAVDMNELIRQCEEEVKIHTASYWIQFCISMCTQIAKKPETCANYETLFSCIIGMGMDCHNY